jgi:hypothetical protein
MTAITYLIQGVTTLTYKPAVLSYISLPENLKHGRAH